MGRHISFLKAALSAVAVVVVTVSCGGSSGQQTGTLTVTIGVVAPITGTEAPIGDAMVKGAQFAAQQATGIKVQLDVQDDACDPQQAVNAANKLVADRVAIVTGFLCSGAALPSDVVLHRAHVPTIVAAASSPAVTQQGYAEIFRVEPDASSTAPAVSKYMQTKWNAKYVALIDDNTAVNKQIANSEKAALEAEGIKTLSMSITPGLSDYGVAVAKIQASGVDAVSVVLYVPEGSLLTKQLVAAGFGDHIMEGEAMNDPQYLQIVGEATAEKLVVVTGPITTQLPAAKTFVDAYKAKYGQDPSPFAVYEVDSLNVAIAAIKQVNSTDPDKLIGALQTIHYNGIIGSISFDSHGQNAVPNYYIIMTVRNGQFVLAT